MSARVHQLFATDADLLAAWNRYAGKARAVAEDPRLLADRCHMDAMLTAFAEYRRLFDMQLERDREGATA